MELPRASVRFSGDAGDGVHLAGDQLTRTSTEKGSAVVTLPDYPAEIRSPSGSLAGVTAFQVQFGAKVETPGDRVTVLVAMNPAALRANLADVEPGGIVIVNAEAFSPVEFAKVGYDRNPLSDDTLAGFRVIKAPIHTLTRDAVAGMKLSPREADRCRSFVALGIVYWLFDRPLDPSLDWLEDRFSSQPDVYKAGKRTLQAGYHFGESIKLNGGPYHIATSAYPPGVYRRVTGTISLALGLAATADRTGREVFYAGFASAPSIDLLQFLLEHRSPGVCAAQAEDDSAAASMALGAAFGGAIGVTATSGPGLGHIADIIGLGVSAELPFVVIHAQRGGPATGLPGKTEQSDLAQALFGRNGECPVPVLAASSPSDGFDVVLEAVRIATRYMTPVILLTDAYLMHAAEPWPIPAIESLPNLRLDAPASPARNNGKRFMPFSRDVRLARPWALPGTPGLEHRIGGLEKEDGTGVVSYEPADHEHMTHVRAQKISQIAGDIPHLITHGPREGEMLLIGWGGTRGAIREAAARLRDSGVLVADAHLRTINPLPANMADVLRKYRRVVVPELNSGQLRNWLRSQFSIDVESFSRVQGKPLASGELVAWVTNEFSRPRLAEAWVE